MNPGALKVMAAIHGVPRSGTSWLGQLVNSSPQVAYRYQPLFSYAFKDRLHQHSSRTEILKFFYEIYVSDDEFLLQKDKINSGAYPEFKKIENPTHVVYKEVRYHHLIENILKQCPEVKIIGIIRHPCAVINSWLKAPREFKSEWDVQQEWRNAPSKNQNRPEEFFGYEKWKEVARLFLRLHRQYSEQFYLIYYRDLIRDTLLEVEKLFAFLNLPVQEQTLMFIHDSTQKYHPDVYAVYRSKKEDDAWKKELPGFIQEAIIKDLVGSDLEFLLDE